MSFGLSEQNSTRIVCLNIRHGGGSRYPGLLAWLKAQDPDVIVLTEWRNNRSGVLIKGAIEDAGYTAFGESRGVGMNGLMIAATKPFTPARLTPLDSSNGEIVAADFGKQVRILGCYFPQLSAKSVFFDVCLGQQESPMPLLIIGDLNTGSNEVDKEDGAAKFACADKFTDLAGKAGMVDLWRRSNGNRREWSWYSAKNGFRIDHAFANSLLISSAKSVECRYDHSTLDNGLTDHSGMIIDIEFP